MRPEKYPSAHAYAVARAVEHVGNPHQQLASVATPATKYREIEVIAGGWFGMHGLPVAVGERYRLRADDAAAAVALQRARYV